MISESLHAEFAHYARDRFPEEACAFILDDQTLYPVPNIHDQPLFAFKMARTAWARASKQGAITGVYHSHTHKDSLSQLSWEDLTKCRKIGLPWYVINMVTGIRSEFDPRAIAPYEGRVWASGYHDCSGLLGDWYKQEWNIDLGIEKIERRPGDWEKEGWDEFRTRFPKMGFVRVDGAPLVKGDIILHQLVPCANPVPNHCSVVISAEENLILHHIMGRLSCRDRLAGYWRATMVSHLRHQSKMA